MDAESSEIINVPSPPTHSKPCTICSTPRDVLIRCQIDSSGTWHFVCPGSCWKDVSGGTIDGDDDHKQYRYGGTWKNKHDAVSGKKKKKGKKAAQDPVKQWQPPPDDDGTRKEENSPLVTRYSQNDKITSDDQVWICRRSHDASWDKEPGKSWTFWKEGS